MTRPWFGTALLTLGVLAVVYYGSLFVAQRKILFPAPPAPAQPNPGAGEWVALQLSSGPNEALFLPPAPGAARAAPLLLFFHGNGELIDFWMEVFDEPRRWGCAVLLVEFPGYGRCAGRSSEASIREAALAAYDWARSDPRVDAARIVPYGRSLGGGAAAHVAVTRPVAALILESAFTSVRPLAARLLVPGFLVRDPFDNLAALETYRGPLLVLHGDRDEVIPVSHGRALAAAVPGAEYHELACGHNDCPRSWSLLRAFLARHGVVHEAARGN